MTDLDIIDEYITKRTADLYQMILVYDSAGVQIPIDLLARRAELNRLREKLKEYKDVMEYGEDENKTANA